MNTLPLPEWLAPTLVAIVVAVIGWLLRSKIADMSRDAEESAKVVREIQTTMMRPADLRVAVLEMGREFERHFNREFYTRREGENLEKLLRDREGA